MPENQGLAALITWLGVFQRTLMIRLKQFCFIMSSPWLSFNSVLHITQKTVLVHKEKLYSPIKCEVESF